MACVTLVSFGKNQKCTPSFLRPRWKMRVISCKRKMPRFPLSDREYFGNEPDVVTFYDNNTKTTLLVFSMLPSLLKWIAKAKHDSYTIYVRSEFGTIRSVYFADKMADHLRSQGHEVTVMHLELSRRTK